LHRAIEPVLSACRRIWEEEENIMEEEFSVSNHGFSRRRFLMAGGALMVASALPGQVLADTGSSHPEPFTYDGSTSPYPIPWLDKNGSHNQPAGLDKEPSHIYHF
jgi:hypothetical protein